MQRAKLVVYLCLIRFFPSGGKYGQKSQNNEKGHDIVDLKLIYKRACQHVEHIQFLPNLAQENL